MSCALRLKACKILKHTYTICTRQPHHFTGISDPEWDVVIFSHNHNRRYMSLLHRLTSSKCSIGGRTWWPSNIHEIRCNIRTGIESTWDMMQYTGIESTWDTMQYTGIGPTYVPPVHYPLHMDPMPWLRNLVRPGCVYTGFLSFLYLSPYWHVINWYVLWRRLDKMAFGAVSYVCGDWLQLQCHCDWHANGHIRCGFDLCFTTGVAMTTSCDLHVISTHQSAATCTSFPPVAASAFSLQTDKLEDLNCTYVRRYNPQPT